MKDLTFSKLSMSLTALALLAVFGLAGCGSGGGGGANEPGTGGEITYTGATTQAKITVDNANDIFSIIWSGGTSPTTGEIAPTKGLRAPGAISTGRIIPYLFSVSDDVNHYIGKEKAKSIAAPKEINETKNGSVSGTLTKIGSIDENTGTGTLTLTYQNYNDGGQTYDGVLTAKVDAYDVSYKIITDMTLSFTLWTIKDKGRSISVSGSVRVQESLSNNTETQTYNVVIRDNNTNETSKQENFVLATTYNNIFTPSSKTETASGRVYIEKYGYVDLSTVSPFIYSAYPQDNPDKGGPVLLSGAGNSKAGIIPVSTSRVRIEVDTDGDGTFESKNIYSWNDLAGEPLPNSTPTANAGPDQNVKTGSTVNLDGSGSSDADGDTLTYAWTFTSMPSGSTVTLSNSTSAKPGFTADIDGPYVLSLVVNDGKVNSTADTVIIIAATSNSTPMANAGTDQGIVIGSLVALDGSGSSDADGDPLTYTWQFTSKPTGSMVVISDTSSSKPTFTADIEGAYVLSLAVSDGKTTSTPDSITVTAYKEVNILNFLVVDAEYSKQLDKIIMVSATPANQLHIYDPVTKQDTSVSLNLSPTSVSVSPDGLYAAVGHNAWISYVNLSTATLVKTLSVSADVLDIVLAGNGYVYAFPRIDQWVNTHCINIATGVETLSTGMSIYAGTKGKLHPTGSYIYGAWPTGISPTDIEKYDISGGTAAYLYNSPYHGDYPMCGDLWISEDGLRIFTRCGNVFRSSTVQSEDMTYNSALQNLSLVKHLSHSSAIGKVAAIPDNSWDTTNADIELRIFGYDYLTFEKSITLPQFIVGSNHYAGHGRFVFYNSDGTKYFVVLQADGSSGMLYDYGVVAY